MASEQPTYEQWLASMVRSTSAAAVLVWDLDGNLLLLHTTYGEGWQLPGGTVEHGQDPWQAAIREFHEETGGNLTGPPALLGVDWCQPEASEPYTQFYFAGPRVERLHLTVTLSDEHDRWEMAPPERWELRLGAAAATRLDLLRQTLHGGPSRYFRDGADVAEQHSVLPVAQNS